MAEGWDVGTFNVLCNPVCVVFVVVVAMSL